MGSLTVCPAGCCPHSRHDYCCRCHRFKPIPTCRARRWKGDPTIDGPHLPHGFTYGPEGLYHGHCAGVPDGGTPAPAPGLIGYKLSSRSHVVNFLAGRTEVTGDDLTDMVDDLIAVYGLPLFAHRDDICDGGRRCQAGWKERYCWGHLPPAADAGSVLLRADPPDEWTRPGAEFTLPEELVLAVLRDSAVRKISGALGVGGDE